MRDLHEMAYPLARLAERRVRADDRHHPPTDQGTATWVVGSAADVIDVIDDLP